MSIIFEKLDSKYIILKSQLSLLRHKINCRRQVDFPKSAFIFTSHKCASSFIPMLSRRIARSSSRSYIDYELASWHLGNLGYGDKVHDKLYTDISCFHPYKFLYAPLRCPPPNYFLSKYSSNPMILFLRDPRDIAISAYYSFGKTHSLPKHSGSRKSFMERRALITSLCIDDFVLYYLEDFIIPQFLRYSTYLSADNVLYLKYSDYVNNTSLFFSKIFNHFECKISESDFSSLAFRMNPVLSVPDINSHRRSGRLNQFKTLLSDSTNHKIYSAYSSVLNLFKFD